MKQFLSESVSTKRFFHFFFQCTMVGFVFSLSHLFVGCAALSVPTMHHFLNASHYWNVPLVLGTRSEGLVYPEAKLFQERQVQPGCFSKPSDANTTCQGFQNKLELNVLKDDRPVSFSL